MFVAGAAGFIASHLIDRFIESGHSVTGVDNFVRGTRQNVHHLSHNPSFELIEADLSSLEGATEAFERASRRSAIDQVWHMAANSDISAGVADPNVDLRDTFLTTFQILAMMRKHSVPVLAFASSSAIYGAYPETIYEATGPLFPISNYGAMKLASEALISAAVESFLSKSYVFRFPNVIGPRATHGVIYDLMHKVKRGPASLEVLGDGTQEKPYLHVEDLVNAMLFVVNKSSDARNVFNIAADGDGATVRFIAETVVAVASPGLPIQYTGGNKGWTGDVPKYSYSVQRLKDLGWSPSMNSRDAVSKAVEEIYREVCRQ